MLCELLNLTSTCFASSWRLPLQDGIRDGLAHGHVNAISRIIAHSGALDELRGG